MIRSVSLHNLGVFSPQDGPTGSPSEKPNEERTMTDRDIVVAFKYLDVVDALERLREVCAPPTHDLPELTPEQKRAIDSVDLEAIIRESKKQ